MMIRIRSRDGLERVTIDNPNITISQLKTLIQTQLGVPINNQTLSTNQNLLLSKTPQEFTQFSDMANPHLPISSLGLSHGSILYLAYEGERTVVGPSVKAAPAGSFGKKMTMDDLIAKQMRVSRQENPHCEMVSFDRDTANVFQSYVNETMAFGVKRGGFMYGVVSDEGKVEVDFIYEPPQQGGEEGLVLMRDEGEERIVDAIALGLGMRRVGFIFTQTISQSKFDYTLSSREVLQAAELQGESELKEWVTAVVKLKVNEDGGADVHFEAFQMSDTCIKLFKEGWFETDVKDGDDPKSSKMKKDVVVGVKDTKEIDNDFFLVVVKISDHQAYALIAKGVRMVCSNTTGKNTKSVVLKTQGSGSLKDNIITVFGMDTFSCLEPISLCISGGCKLDGFLSKSGHGSGRYMSDRQFFFVNGRPVDMPKVGKLVNELYKGANSRQFPIAILDFTLPSRACDVNVTPDKRKIFFSEENAIFDSLREALQNIYSPGHVSFSVNRCENLSKGDDFSKHDECSQLSPEKFSMKCSDSKEEADNKEQCENGGVHHYTTTKEGKNRSSVAEVIAIDTTSKAGIFSRIRNRQPVNHVGSTTTAQHALLHSGDAKKPIVDNIDSPGRASTIQSSLSNFVTVNKRKHESISTALTETPLLRGGSVSCQSEKISPQISTFFSKSLVKCHENEGSDVVKNTDLGSSKKCLPDRACNETNHISFSGTMNSREYGQLRGTRDEPENREPIRSTRNTGRFRPRSPRFVYSSLHPATGCDTGV